MPRTVARIEQGKNIPPTVEEGIPLRSAEKVFYEDFQRLEEKWKNRGALSLAERGQLAMDRDVASIRLGLIHNVEADLREQIEEKSRQLGTPLLPEEMELVLMYLPTSRETKPLPRSEENTTKALPEFNSGIESVKAGPISVSDLAKKVGMSVTGIEWRMKQKNIKAKKGMLSPEQRKELSYPPRKTKSSRKSQP